MNHLPDFSKIKQWSPTLYSYTFPLKILGADFGRRMIIVKAPDDRLLLLSPFPLHDFVNRELASIGRIEAIVYPTAFHDTRISEMLPYLKTKDVYTCQGLDWLPNAQPIDSLPDKWRNLLDWQILAGMPKANETVFYHKKSNTLLPSDLLFKFTPDYYLWTRLLAKISQVYSTPNISRIFRSYIEDRPAFDQSLKKILTWDFHSILPSHADPIGPEGRQALEKYLET